ncbi:MAG: 4Fe-4S binding protein, partial [Bacteroidales bacterium]|nr:4Fe-4S binding protein [Bacteroidales bacterium]
MSYLYTKTSSSHLQAYPLDNTQKAGIGLSVFGLLILIATLFDVQLFPSVIWLVLSIVCILAGVTVYSVFTYKKMPAGIKNNGIYHISLTNRGLLGWIAGVMLTAFYVLLYWFPQGIGLGTDGESNTRLVALFDPFSMWIKNQPASEWFVYGTLYTLAILSFGIKFILKYWHNRYQLYRTIVVIFCQLFLAYIIPEIMEGLSDPEKYFAKDLKFFWPLNYYFFDAWHINNMTASGSLGMVFLVWGIVGVLLVTPVLTYFLGKRWYCSWVCGCGGLAETAGDPFRHLSNKTMESWRLERILIYSILGFIIIVTGVVLYGYFSGSGSFLGLDIYSYFSRPYAFFIGAAFSG